jgi:hypothetical protein
MVLHSAFSRPKKNELAAEQLQAAQHKYGTGAVATGSVVDYKFPCRLRAIAYREQPGRYGSWFRICAALLPGLVGSQASASIALTN